MATTNLPVQLTSFIGREDDLAEALTMAREAGDTYRIAMALNFLGDLARCEQNYAQAQALYEESLVLLRETEVATLIARGLTNGQIAAELVLSKRTVEHHIANILAKLHFTNRVQIVRWAIENGLAEVRDS